MATNFIQPGHTITVTAPYDLASGAGCKVGSFFGVAQAAAASGDPVEIMTVGVHELPKLGTDTPAQGAALYWDDTNKRLTTTATSNTLIGAATEAAASGDATVKVRLNV